MPKTRRFILLISFLLLLIALLTVGRWGVGRAFPQMSGVLELDGLQGQVEIRRDAAGVPHIYASTLHDVYMAQGALHAQERLWQMDLQRRVGLGRVSDLLGESTVEIDQFFRTIGTHIAAEQDLEAMLPRDYPIEAREALEAYSKGVNAYMATVPVLPLEYQLLGAEWPPWTPLDTLASAKMMQWGLSGDWEEELFRAGLMQHLGAEESALLLDDAALVGITMTHSIGSPNLDLKTLSAMLEPLGVPLSSRAGHGGSNAWVVSADFSRKGRAILANDTHLGIGMPDLWYEVGLHTPQMEVIGASVPGIPAIIIGHNKQMAWGMTHLASDTQDLFIERLNDAQDAYEWHAGRELGQIKMKPLTVRQETIQVKDGADIVLEVKESHHGPLLNQVIEGLDVPIALQWHARQTPTHLIESILGINFAQNREQFVQASQLWTSPAQTMLYADYADYADYNEGQIGRVVTGELPIRRAAGGLLPQPGWTGEWEWQGIVPTDALPQEWNPTTGQLVSANQPPFPDDFPYYVGRSWAEASRIKRIEHLLAEHHVITRSRMRAIQQDVFSLPAQQMVPLLLQLESDHIITQRAQAQLAEWNHQMDGELPGAAIYAVTRTFVLQELLTDEFSTEKIGRDLFKEYLNHDYNHTVLLLTLLEQPQHPLWDDTRTPQVEQRDDILLRALEQMTDWLGRRFGDVPHEWFWKRLHIATFEHPLATNPLLKHVFNYESYVNGDGSTVNVSPYSLNHDYRTRHLGTYRQVIEIGE